MSVSCGWILAISYTRMGELTSFGSLKNNLRHHWCWTFFAWAGVKFSRLFHKKRRIPKYIYDETFLWVRPVSNKSYLMRYKGYSQVSHWNSFEDINFNLNHHFFGGKCLITMKVWLWVLSVQCLLRWYIVLMVLFQVYLTFYTVIYKYFVYRTVMSICYKSN